MPYPPSALISPGFTSNLIDATGEKVAMVGRVWNKDRTSKNITKVGFRFGAVTKAGGSALIVSLQDESTALGPVYQPDETQDQTVAIANADAGFAANVWYQTNALSSPRAVAFGERLGVVIEYDGAGRLGADLVNITGFTTAVTGRFLEAGGVLKTAGWAVSAALNDVILEFDDGTFGTLTSGLPGSATSTLAYNSGSAADEVALEFQVPFICRVDGAWVLMSAAASASYDIVLYDAAGAVLATSSTDFHQIEAAASAKINEVAFPEVTLAVNTTYRLSLKPTTANSVTAYFFDVANANHMQALAGGTAWFYASRVDAGAWTPIATRRPFMGLRFSALGAP